MQECAGKPPTALANLASNRFFALPEAERAQWAERAEWEKKHKRRLSSQEDMGALLTGGGERKAVKRYRSPSSTSSHQHLRIYELNGDCFEVSVASRATILDVKLKLRDLAQVSLPVHEQCLLNGTAILRDCLLMEDLGSPAELTLVRRPKEQADWIKKVGQEIGGWLDLRRAPKRIRADREVILSAVQWNGYALQFASSSLKSDPEIVAAAITQDKNARQFARN